MKRNSVLIAATLLVPLGALAQTNDVTLKLPVNSLPGAAFTEAEADATATAANEAASGVAAAEEAGVSDRAAMVIEENGTVRFLSAPDPAPAAVPGADDAITRPAPVFDVVLDKPDSGPDTLTILATGGDISETTTPDGTTRMIRIDPGNGEPPILVTITKN